MLQCYKMMSITIFVLQLNQLYLLVAHGWKYFRSYEFWKRCAPGMFDTWWRGWVLLSAERKSPLLSKWKSPGSLSLMVWRHYWEHKAVPWIPMGGCWILEGTQPPADKHCQLAEGPYSSAMCSHLINRTHSLRQVQANTKPFPWALGFLLISLSMSIKKALLWC